MKKRTYIYIVIIVLSMIYTIMDYNMAKHRSYDMYVSGEFFFRQKATTVNTHGEDWWATPEAQNIDYSDPKSMLLCLDGGSVWASDPHDGVCTVIYGDNVVEDFPISNLRFENDDADYFYGKKRYSYDEYIEIVRSLKEEKSDTMRVSDLKKMASFDRFKPALICLAIVDALLAAVVVILLISELYDKISTAMFWGALFSLIFSLYIMIMLKG